MKFFFGAEGAHGGATAKVTLHAACLLALLFCCAAATPASATTFTVNNNGNVSDADPGNSNPDFNFRFTGGEYQFNLQTGGYATGTHLLSFKAGNSPATYTVEFKVR